MRVSTRQAYHCVLLRIVEQVLRDPSDGTTLSPLVESIGYSKDHLNRFFTENLGEPLGDFIRRIRLERSAFALLNANQSVFSASILAGYSEPEAFAKAFRRAFGLSPSAFRKAGISWRIDCASGVHWCDEGVRKPLVPRAEEFGLTFVSRDETRLQGRELIGDYRKIPGAWAALGRELPPGASTSVTWVTVFHSDGLREHKRESMRAHLGYLGDEKPLGLGGFQALTIPGGPYVTTAELFGGQAHAEAWLAMNTTWVPKVNRSGNLPGFDIYTSFPQQWEDVQARLFLSLREVDWAI